MSRSRKVADEWPFNVLVKCKKCERQLLNYHAWRDGDREGTTGGERWEPADAMLTQGSKFHFICDCRARPQVRYDKVAQAASPYGQAVLRI